MPAAPELANRLGKIRTVEVLHELDAEQFCRADRDVGISGKVAINLERKEDCRRDERQSLIIRQISIDHVDVDGQRVRDDDLLE